MVFVGGKHTKWWKNLKTFSMDGIEYPYFVHRHNCGWPPYRMTERAVELSLADAWLSHREGQDNVIEVGAVTPYYWPRRVLTIVDPYDDHAGVTQKASLFDISFVGKKIVSISTFEHVGQGDYGLEAEKGLAAKAVEKLISQADEFLVTIPTGYNKALDDFIVSRALSLDRTNVSFLTRGNGDMDNDWRQAEADKGIRPYEKSANGLVVLYRGSI